MLTSRESKLKGKLAVVTAGELPSRSVSSNLTPCNILLRTQKRTLIL